MCSGDFFYLTRNTDTKRKASKDAPVKYVPGFKAVPLGKKKIADVVKEVVAKVNASQAATNLPLLPQ
jgi:hypothetical protein